MELFPSYPPSLLSGHCPSSPLRDLGLSGRKVGKFWRDHQRCHLYSQCQVTRVPGSGKSNCWSSSSGPSQHWWAWLLCWAATDTVTRDFSSQPQWTISVRTRVTFSSTGCCSASPGWDPVPWSSTVTSRYWRPTGDVGLMFSHLLISLIPNCRTNNQALFRCIGKTNGSAQALKNIKIRRLVRFSVEARRERGRVRSGSSFAWVTMCGWCPIDALFNSTSKQKKNSNYMLNLFKKFSNNKYLPEG